MKTRMLMLAAIAALPVNGADLNIQLIPQDRMGVRAPGKIEELRWKAECEWMGTPANLRSFTHQEGLFFH